ncbi:protein kinase domain-containing protein [Streptobacillus canis]|uniref:protein kinase domain-containing protein n=1 Tax=Streptobacillus canis TaxID=2678686 RepID=UPI0012E2E44D|nr:RIO1 family regulatory kinase/ATPase [Streptobacillus canis]
MEIEYYKKTFDISLPGFDLMFKNEINTMIYLLMNKIKCIPKILRVKIQKDNKEIFYEKINGETLYDYNIEKLSLKEKLELYLKILEAVFEIHELGLIHNDINTCNIIINGNEVYLIDFSEARFIEKYYDKKYYSYTRGFSSIERYSNIEKNYYENDTYSLTAIFYFIIFNKKNPDICDTKYNYITHNNKKIEFFLKKGLSLNRLKRHRNIKNMIEKISDIIEKL